MPTAALTAAFQKQWGGFYPGLYPLQPSGESTPVTFPTSPLTARVYIALGADLTASWLTWNWLDITARVRFDLGVQITAGRRNGATVTNSAECLLKLTNTDGYLSRLNPNSPYFGQITKLTPVWIQLNPGSGFVDRFHGYINASAIGWSDLSGTDSFVVVRCGGVLRRLAQGDPVDDALSRTILSDGPLHYWRIDDPTGSTSAASSLPGGGERLTMVGTVDWQNYASPPGGDGATSAARLKTGYLLNHSLNVAPPWTVEWAVLRPADGTLDGFSAFGVTFLVGGRQTVGFTTAADTTVSTNWHHYKIEGTQNGANWEINWWKNGVSRGLATSGAGTLGALTEIDLYGGYTPAAESSVGFAAIYSGSGVIDASKHSGALQAFDGEMAHVRVARLCAEQGIPVVALAGASAAMGPQPAGKLLDLLRECETVDQGFLFEREFGVEYRALSELYNQPVSLALDFNSRHVMGMPQPADDDQRTRNRWTISRPGGITATAEEDEGSMGTGPGGPGSWPDSASMNLDTDSQVFNDASWRVHVGTVDEYRLPSIPLKMHGTPDLIPTWLAMRIGRRATLANPPAQMRQTSANVDVILEGYAERFDQVSWDVGLNTSPASPYTVLELDSNASRFDSDTSSLAAAISTSDTSWSVATTDAHDLWTTDAAQFPFFLEVRPGPAPDNSGGEVVTVTNITGSSSPQTFTVTRSTNGIVKAHAAGAKVRVYQPGFLAR